MSLKEASETIFSDLEKNPKNLFLINVRYLLGYYSLKELLQIKKKRELK